MPQHQDNVDVVLVTNPRPARVFAGDFTLDVPDPVDAPIWWGQKFDDRILRQFRAQAMRSKFCILMEVVCNGRLDTTVDPMFGERERFVAGDPKMSEFTWHSTADHVVSLSLGAEFDDASVPVNCLDPSPTHPVWKFSIGAGNRSATFTADFSATLGTLKTPKVASFTAVYPR